VVAAAIGMGGVVFQVNAEDERSKTEFLRDKKQLTFVEYLADEGAYTHLTDAYMAYGVSRGYAE
jgi:hypothetical protein